MKGKENNLQEKIGNGEIEAKKMAERAGNEVTHPSQPILCSKSTPQKREWLLITIISHPKTQKNDDGRMHSRRGPLAAVYLWGEDIGG